MSILFIFPSLMFIVMLVTSYTQSIYTYTHIGLHINIYREFISESSLTWNVTSDFDFQFVSVFERFLHVLQVIVACLLLINRQQL